MNNGIDNGEKRGDSEGMEERAFGSFHVGGLGANDKSPNHQMC